MDDREGHKTGRIAHGDDWMAEVGSMISEATCRKVVPADEAACRMGYCRHCDMTEVVMDVVLERMATPVSMPMTAEWAGNVH